MLCPTLSGTLCAYCFTEANLSPLTLFKVPGHQSVFMNEPRLSDFKQVLLREGIQAEFVGGVLVCNNQVAVRRVSLFFVRAALNMYVLLKHINSIVLIIS